jgi:hypothetical protein
LNQPELMERPRAGTRYIILVLAAIPLSVLILLIVWPGPKYQSPPLPRPNGYEDLLSAGRSVGGTFPDDTSTNQAALRLFLVGNTNALAEIRIGLGHECRVTLDASPAAATNATRMVDLADLKNCARLLTLEGRLAQLEAKTQHALNSYLDLFRLGCAVTRGGVVIDAQVGLAIQTRALSQLDGLVDNLEPEQASALAKELPLIISSSDSAQTILEHEQIWAKEVFGWRSTVLRLFRPGLALGARQSLLAKFSSRDAAVARLLERTSARSKPRE